jgi:hypothetical protein
MTNKLFCNRGTQLRSSKFLAAVLAAAFCLLAGVPQCRAGDAPQWMRALVNAPLPEHDEKTDAVLLYSETNVNVISADKIKTTVREAFKILRPDGRRYGTAEVYYNSPGEKVTSLHGWCIPAQGKDYEVKDKDALDVAPPGIEGGELISDARAKILLIPAPDPGNIVGYEYEKEEQPLVLQEGWGFQEAIPVRESHFSLQLPAGWEFKASFLNYPEVKPTESGNNLWQWTVTDVRGIRPEQDMPPFAGVVGAMIVSLITQQAREKEFSNWREMGVWYWNLEKGSLDASPELKQKVAALTASSPTTLDKMRVLANFVQHDIRYVAIELGIGGWKPHPATDIFAHHYGDCKDKATLMRAMLQEIGVKSFQVAINTERGSITPDTPAYQGFDHQITVIQLPDGVSDDSLVATVQHPKLGRLLFFDPTNDLVPFGQIPEYEQASYALVVSPDGGDLVQVPKQPSAMNSIVRTAKLTLDPSGKLQGDVKEVRLGQRAWYERGRLLTVTRDTDRVKPIEELLGSSLSNFRITDAKVVNLQQTSLPFGFVYSFEAAGYAKNAGGLLLVRPRVIGSKADAVLETKEPRKFPIEFPGPVRDTDSFEITLPPGYEVDDLPPPVDADFEFASYHSKTEVKGDVIGYTRTFEVKELSVPVSKSEELKKFYRIIASDERNTAVLKPK